MTYVSEEYMEEKFDQINRLIEKLKAANERIVQLEQERKEIARDAWDAAIRITGHPFGVKGFAPDKAVYLSRFEQTKTESSQTKEDKQ